MPDSRPAQTYSTLLEDRRIIESAAEANESPSLIVHLLEKDWSIRPGRAPNNTGARRFSYSEPISGLLDDIQARRIPVEFTDIFKKLDVKFFEGCLIVEMHDSRPTKGGPSKNVDARIDKYVLRPTAESLWAEIRNVVDGQQGWGDKEALELEARIVLATAPPLCLDPSPTVNRIANVITRIGAYPTKTSLKRRQSEDTEDDIDSLKRRKLMQLMNPRVGKPFVPKYRALMHKDAASQRPPAESNATPTAVANAGGPVVATSSTMAQGIQLRPNILPTATTTVPPAQQTLANVSQAGLAARPRPMPLKIGPDAQHAATLSLAARNRINAAQNLVAAAQGGRPLPQVTGQVAAAIANATVAPGNANSSVNNATNNVPNQDALSQFAAQQPGKPPISLTMPTVIKRSSGASSPPKVSALPAGPSNPPSQINSNNQPPNPSATPVPATPQMQPSTPQMASQTPTMHPTQMPPNTQAVNPLTNYHQNVANGQQNQMHSAAAGLNGVRAPYPGFVNQYQGTPQVNRPTTAQMLIQNGIHPQMMAYQAALQQQQQQQRLNAVAAQRQQLLQQMNAGMNLSAQMPAGSMYNGSIPLQQPMLNHSKIIQTAEEKVAKIPPHQLAAFAANAPAQLQAMPNWHNLTDYEKAKLHMRHAIEVSARAALQRGVGRPPADGSTAQPQINR